MRPYEEIICMILVFYKWNCYNGCLVNQNEVFSVVKQSNFIINLERTMHVDFLTPKRISSDIKTGNVIANHADTTQW